MSATVPTTLPPALALDWADARADYEMGFTSRRTFERIELWCYREAAMLAPPRPAWHLPAAIDIAVEVL